MTDLTQKVVFFDIDGTLTHDHQPVEKQTCQAIEQLKVRGVLPVLATGRPPVMLKEVSEQVGIENFISMNGQYIYLNGAPLYKNPLPFDVVSDLLDFARESGHQAMIFNADEILGGRLYQLATSKFAQKVGRVLGKWAPRPSQNIFFKLAFKNQFDKEMLANEDIYQVVLQVSPEEEQPYIEKFGDRLGFTRSSEYVMDVIGRHMNKAQGVQRVVDHLGVDLENTYAFGDNINDLEMLKYVGHGIAMADGAAEAQAVADFITPSSKVDGIAHGLRHFELIE